MSKDGIKLPQSRVPLPREPQQPLQAPASGKSTASSKPTIAEKKQQQRLERAPRPQVQRQQRPQRGRGPANAAHANAVDAAESADAAANDQGALQVEAGDELHGRRHSHAEALWDDAKVEEHHDVEGQESGRTSADAVKRDTGADTGGGDGFDQNQQQREAYERYLKGTVSADKERFDALRAGGKKDTFRADASALEVEALGVQRAAGHVVRLYDNWTLSGLDRKASIAQAAAFLSGFQSITNIKKVIAELETQPIRDVYPLEVLLEVQKTRPELLPGVQAGDVIHNAAALNGDDAKVFAGHPVQLAVPANCRLKSFALLGGGRPGYEFFPTAGSEAHYTLLVDTPGRYRFAVLAAPLQQLGRIQRETQEALVHIFDVHVWAMGKKDEPVSAEQWLAAQDDDTEDEGDADADAADMPLDPSSDEQAARIAGALPAFTEEFAPLLAIQVRRMLDRIHKDCSDANAATTYSWPCVLYAPGTRATDVPILRVTVKNAGPFDPVWHKAREAIAKRQAEFEPSRKPLTQDDVTAAIRRARVREA